MPSISDNLKRQTAVSLQLKHGLSHGAGFYVISLDFLISCVT